MRDSGVVIYRPSPFPRSAFCMLRGGLLRFDFAVFFPCSVVSYSGECGPWIP